MKNWILKEITEMSICPSRIPDYFRRNRRCYYFNAQPCSSSFFSPRWKITKQEHALLCIRTHVSLFPATSANALFSVIYYIRFVAATFCQIGRHTGYLPLFFIGDENLLIDIANRASLPKLYLIFYNLSFTGKFVRDKYLSI